MSPIPYSTRGPHLASFLVQFIIIGSSFSIHSGSSCLNQQMFSGNSKNVDLKDSHTLHTSIQKYKELHKHSYFKPNQQSLPLSTHQIILYHNFFLLFFFEIFFLFTPLSLSSSLIFFLLIFLFLNIYFLYATFTFFINHHFS